MDEKTLQSIAEQLRKPHGEYAIEVGEKMNEGNHYINLFTIEALDLKNSDHILEIGMGNGFFVKEIVSVSPSIKYVGCDFSEIMVEESCKNNEAFIKAGQAKFYLSNATHLPFEQEAFDKVFSVNTLYFWDDPEIVLTEIRRILKPGGQITLSIRPKSVMEHYPFVKYGFAMFAKDDLVNLLASNGFKITAVFEKTEPAQVINGEQMIVETLIVNAIKIA